MLYIISRPSSFYLLLRQLCGLEAHKTLCVVVLHHIVDIGNLVSPMQNCNCCLRSM